MAELLKNPVVIRKVKRELRDIVGMRTEVKKSYIEHFPYLLVVVKEIL